MGVRLALRSRDHPSENGSRRARPWCGTGFQAVPCGPRAGPASHHGRTMLRLERVGGGVHSPEGGRGAVAPGTSCALREPPAHPSGVPRSQRPPGTPRYPLPFSECNCLGYRVSPPTPGCPPSTAGFAPCASPRVHPLTHWTTCACEPWPDPGGAAPLPLEVAPETELSPCREHGGPRPSGVLSGQQSPAAFCTPHASPGGGGTVPGLVAAGAQATAPPEHAPFQGLTHELLRQQCVCISHENVFAAGPDASIFVVTVRCF